MLDALRPSGHPARSANVGAGHLARWSLRVVALAYLGAILLVLVGVLLVTGLWGELVAVLRGPIAGFEMPI